jgi:hypothetical protein
LSGQASIIDGDTLEIHGTRIRLWRIDAPESAARQTGRDGPLEQRVGIRLFKCRSLLRKEIPVLRRAHGERRAEERPQSFPTFLRAPV